MQSENNHDTEAEKLKTCANCHAEIRLGEDLWSVEEGVMGPRGVVPLGDLLIFCSRQCVSDFFDGKEREQLERRIP